MRSSYFRKSRQIIIDAIGLQTARGRIFFLGIVSLAVYIVPIRTLAGLSIWKNLGFDAPSVGLTRAYHYVLHGNIDQAWQQNGLIFLVLAIGLPLIAKDLYNVVKQLMLRSDHGRSE